MRTECNPSLMRFARLKGRDVVADFAGGSMTVTVRVPLQLPTSWVLSGFCRNVLRFLRKL